jgi:hypothetical protein
VNFEVPAGACDCHTHVFLNAEKFRFSAERATKVALGGLH